MVSVSKSAGLGAVSGNTANCPGPNATSVDVASSSRPMAARRSRSKFYTPPLAVRPVPGVDKAQAGSAFDDYTGSLEHLVRTGLADPSMFPGQPGNGAAVATYLPIGCDGAAWDTPGRITISRHGHSGLFRIRLVVSAQERAAREQAEEQRKRSDAKRYFSYDCESLMHYVDKLPIDESAPLLRVAIALLQEKLTSVLASEEALPVHGRQRASHHLRLVASPTLAIDGVAQ